MGYLTMKITIALLLAANLVLWVGFGSLLNLFSTLYLLAVLFNMHGSKPKWH